MNVPPDELKLLPAETYLEFRHKLFALQQTDSYRKLQQMRKVDTEEGYSYKPFDEKRAIFFHIPKCAGISVCKALFGNLAGGHISLQNCINIFQPEELLSYYKFTFVRNPWDRVVSAYHFLKSGGINKSDKSFAEKELSAFDTFEEFVQGWLTRENIVKGVHFLPQHIFIMEEYDKVRLDFLGYFENIDEDFNRVAAKLGCDAQLPTLNKGSHKSYMDYYSDRTIEIVAQVYAEDVELLGYVFDNSNIPDLIGQRDRIFNTTG